MDNPIQEILEKQVLTVAKAMEDKLDEEIASLEKLDEDDLEIPSEKEFFAAVKSSERVVCHFYRENWPCKVMEKHMSILAKQHIETRFVKIQAEKSPFLAERLKIVVLPTLALIKNTKVDDYVVGFNELGGKDDFSTEDLEDRLARAQVIHYEGESSLKPKSTTQTKRSVRQSAYSDSDWE
ncbi:unnamed protein product [Arabis nemorensis]|uniref:Thioredoxin domain-containing protein n=1 Tax=Arabis nemorensis TaxID=586526 RepID=A0A565C9S7_9BRAS|nr:unnamed protein product [Arabis nemorensis]